MSGVMPALESQQQKTERDRKRRWRLLLIPGSISIGWKVPVFTVGAALPTRLIDDGIAVVRSEHRPYATGATGGQ